MFPSSVEEHLTSPGQPPHLGQELLHLGHLSLWTKANILGRLRRRRLKTIVWLLQATDYMYLGQGAVEGDSSVGVRGERLHRQVLFPQAAHLE